jgi:hypothetical protein
VAGFEAIFHGRFWVITEVATSPNAYRVAIGSPVLDRDANSVTILPGAGPNLGAVS